MAGTRVVVAGKIHPAGLRILEDLVNLDLVVIDDPDVEIPIEEVARADALLIRYGILTEAAAARAARLRVVSRHGVGCDNLPLATLTARGIPVTIVGPVSAVSVAEHAMALMLAAVKKLIPYQAALRQGNWRIRDTLGATELGGKTLLLLGFGRIGREVAKRASGFDMRVLAYDPQVSEEEMRRQGVTPLEDWREALSRVDVLSIHLPLTPDTRNIVDAGVLERLKPTALIVNTARGGVVDETALHQALTGRLAAGGAALDTFAVEPLSPKSPLCDLPNVLLSPHSASLTQEAAQRMGVVAARNVVDGLAGTLDPALIVNFAALNSAHSARSEIKLRDP